MAKKAGSPPVAAAPRASFAASPTMQPQDPRPRRTTRAGWAALVRFHGAVGARLAMRLLLPALVAAAAAVMLYGSQVAALVESLARMVFRGGSGVVVTLVCLGAARVAAPRVCRGMTDWLAHLPASGRQQAGAAGLGVALAELPVVAALAGLAVLAGGPVAGNLAGLGLAALATAAAVLPLERRWLSAPAALAAAVLAASGRWPGLLAGAILLAGVAALAGRPRRRHPLRGEALAGGACTGGSAVITGVTGVTGVSGLPSWFALRIVWRALGWRLAASQGAGLVVLGATGLFLANNSLPPADAALAVRLGSGVLAVALVAGLAGPLAALRPAWPWARSLPWTAARRVAADALWLAAAAVPQVVALGWLAAAQVAPGFPARGWWAGLSGLLWLPALALRGAASMRRAPARRTGAGGLVAAEGLPAAAAVALLPWTAALLLAALPLAWRSAAEVERRQKVSRWLALHHLAAGDPQAWSGR